MAELIPTNNTLVSEGIDTLLAGPTRPESHFEDYHTLTLDTTECSGYDRYLADTEQPIQNEKTTSARDQKNSQSQ